MKKRVKLLTTIASLCLAVALMAFGVYAASNPSFTASGTISFTSENIDGNWTTLVATVTGGKFATGEGVATDGLTFTVNASEGGTLEDITIPEVSVDTVTTGNATATVTIKATFVLTEGSNAAALSATGSKTDTAGVITLGENVTDEATDTTPVVLTFTVDFSTAFSTTASGSYAVAFAAEKK